MTKIPEQENTIQNLIDKSFEMKEQLRRPHLGCSLVGKECDRELWLSFRFAYANKFPGRLLRVFRRGSMEEAVVVSDLRDIDISIINTGSQQRTIDLGKHVGGSIDGIITSGVPHAPKSKAVLEIKTHSEKSFKDVSEKGVEKSKWQHFVQMQLYMLGTKIDRALYYAVNKNTDEIYTEWVKFDKEVAQTQLDRAQRITMSDRIPEPCAGASASWWVCKMCPANHLCHGSGLTDQVNCRTCCHSTATEEGTWTCAKYECEIPFEAQLEGCEAHLLHPDLVPWQMDADHSDENHITWLIEGKPVVNGEADATTYSSKELVINWKACVEPDEMMQEMRETMGARVVG